MSSIASPFGPIHPPCPHTHQVINLGNFINANALNPVDAYQLHDSLSPGVPVDMSPTGETICARCKVSYCCRQLFMLHLETSLEHNLCILCHYTKDFGTFTALQDHLEQEHLWCEPCNWFAPSYEGLLQHFQHKHLMCLVCKETFRNLNEFTGHANVHRPLTLSCIFCPEKFALRSALFNHIESGNCDGGATPEDIRHVVKKFWNALTPELKVYRVPESHMYACRPCYRQYQRLSDLLQHKENKKCPEGYSQGNSITDRLVEYVQRHLPVVVHHRLRPGRDEYRIPKVRLMAPAAAVHPRVGMLRKGDLA